MGRAEAQLEALRSRNAELLKQNSLCEDRLAEARSRADGLAAQNEQYSTYISELESGIRAAETAKASLADECGSLSSRTETLEKFLAEVQTEKLALGEEIIWSRDNVFAVTACSRKHGSICFRHRFHGKVHELEVQKVTTAISCLSLPSLCRRSPLSCRSAPQETAGR